MRFSVLILALGALFMCSCATVYDPYQDKRISAYHPRVQKPVVAVAGFENQAGFNGQWKLGEGMADMLITELIDSRRVVVLERAQLGTVFDEIVRQSKDWFRPEGRIQPGRLKNARYLITGAITDFTVVGDASGWFGTSRAKAKGGGAKARVSLHLRVSDVETGEILGSVKSSASATAGFFGGAVNYKQFSLGGDAFFRTPLGKATERAIRSAVQRTLDVLPVETWRPLVAEAGPDSVIINGGRNVGLEIGDRFRVRKEGRVITDPATGDVLERVPGPEIGVLEVFHVNEASASARIVEGLAHRADMLEPF